MNKPRKNKQPGKQQQTLDATLAEIIDAIRGGQADPNGWQMPWTRIVGFQPVNAQSRKAYRGGNWMLLAWTAMARGLEGNWWATYNQWKALGAQVRKGATSATIAVPKPTRLEDKETGEETTRLFFGYASVFHFSEVDGWEPPASERPHDFDPMEAGEAMLGRWMSNGMDVRLGGNEAFYHPGADYVQVPDREQFAQREHFYGTVGHEATHWTQTPDRCDRPRNGSRFGNAAYAMEELVAEMGAAMIAASLGVEPAQRTDHAAYIANWLQVLDDDPKVLITQAGKAQKAIAFLDALGAPIEEEVDEGSTPLVGSAS